jgi:hypothetical protein
VKPPQRVVAGLVGVGVCERGCRVHARVRNHVPVEIGAARRAAAEVRDQVLCAGVSLAAVGRYNARHFAVAIAAYWDHSTWLSHP